MKVSFNPYLVQKNSCRQTNNYQSQLLNTPVSANTCEAKTEINFGSLGSICNSANMIRKFGLSADNAFKILKSDRNLSTKEFSWLYEKVLGTHNEKCITEISDIAIDKLKGNAQSLYDLALYTLVVRQDKAAAKMAGALAVDDELIRRKSLNMLKGILIRNSSSSILNQVTNSLENYMKFDDSKTKIYSFLKTHLLTAKCINASESLIFFEFLEKVVQRDLKEWKNVSDLFELYDKEMAAKISENKISNASYVLYGFLKKKVDLAKAIFKKADKEKPEAKDAEDYAFNMMKGIVSKLDYPGQWDVFTGSVSLIKNLLVSDRQNSYGLGLLKEGLENSSTRQSMFEHDVFKTAFNNAKTKAGAFDLLEFKDTELFGMRWPKTFDALIEYAKDSQFTKRAFEKFKPALAENSALKLVSLSKLSPFVKFTETREEALGYLYEALKSDDYRTRKVAVDCVFDFLGTDKELDGHARKILAPFIKRDFEMVVGDMNSIADFDIFNSELGDLSLKFLDARRLLDNLNSLSNKELVMNYTNYTEARNSYIKGAISFSQNSVQSLKDIPQLVTPDIERLKLQIDAALQGLYRPIGRI